MVSASHFGDGFSPPPFFRECCHERSCGCSQGKSMDKLCYLLAASALIGCAQNSSTRDRSGEPAVAVSAPVAPSSSSSTAGDRLTFHDQTRWPLVEKLEAATRHRDPKVRLGAAYMLGLRGPA